MSRIAYVNGRYQSLPHAAVNVEDRGFQFADGIYEVCEIRGGRLVDEARHLARMERSLAKLRIAAPVSTLALRVIIREVVLKNRVTDGLAYVQITRGVAPRAHAFPTRPVRPTLVVTARRLVRASAGAGNGIKVITYPEIRWARVDIKTVSLLPNVLAKQAAYEAGAAEAWFVDTDGMINEGAASNAWIVSEDGALVTAPTTAPILEGVTRSVVFDIVRRLRLTFEERRFSLDEAHRAREAFITSATTLVTPVIEIDDAPVAGGKLGETARELRAALLDTADIAPLLASPLA